MEEIISLTGEDHDYILKGLMTLNCNHLKYVERLKTDPKIDALIAKFHLYWEQQNNYK